MKKSWALFILTLALTGCITEKSFRSEVLPRAAFELGCPADQVTVTPLGDASFGVSGCGKKAVYMHVARVGYVNNTGVGPDVARASAPIPGVATTSPTRVYPAHVPPAEEFVVIPLRVYLLRGHGDASTAFAGDVPRIVAELNHIFGLAGVYFNLEAPPQAVELEREVPWHYAGMKSVLPTAPSGGGARLFVVRDLDVNSAGLGGGDFVVQERPMLRLVPGPLAHPVARAAAHAIAGGLGLTTSPYPSMLMAQGTTGVLLDASNLKTMHDAASGIRGAKSFNEAASSGSYADAVAAIHARAEPTLHLVHGSAVPER